MLGRLHPVLAAAALAAVLAWPARAAAYEQQWRLGLSLGYDAYLTPPASSGLGGGLDLSYGLNDTFNLMAEADVSAHPYGQWAVVSGGVGVGYKIDVGPWLPWVGAVAGPAEIISLDPACGLSIAEPCKAFRVNLELPFGLDYRVSRRFALGMGGRFQVLLLGDYPTLTLGAFLRGQVIWGKL